MSAAQPGRDHVEALARRAVLGRLFGGAKRVRIGRYELLRTLGQGATGVVYEARDPELRRRVAVKILRAATDAGTLAHRTARILREAQALARLAHRNIIPVYDVGTCDCDGGVYLVMELARGATLSRWLELRPPWREVLRVFTDAGRGLAAAHEAGIIHRDFKPHNVQIGERVLVLDFGLAGDALGGPSAGTGLLAGTLTETGEVLGTPVYMAPEQHAGGRSDARTDQFAFCVSLFEGLYGTRPFAEDTATTLVDAKLRGAIVPPPRSSVVPRQVFAILRRGLDPDPSRRWNAMTSLLEALTRAAQRRAPTYAGAAALVATAAVGIGIAAAAPEVTPCELGYAARRGEVREALLASTTPFPDATARRLDTRLTAYADAWGAACRSGHSSCLDSRRSGFHTTVDLLVGNADALGASAIEIAGELPPVGGCDTSSEHRADRLLAELEHVDPWLNASQCAPAAERARNVVAAARRDAPAVLPEALRQLGRAQLCLEQADTGSRTLAQAYFTAVDHGQEDVALAAAIDLADAELDAGSLPDAEDWLRHARGHASESTPAGLNAGIMRIAATLDLIAEDFESARDNFDTAAALLRTVVGDQHHDVLSLRLSSTLARAALDPIHDVLRRLEEITTEIEDALGPAHPLLGHAAFTDGTLADAAGLHARAALSYATAARRWAALPVPPRDDIARALAFQGSALSTLGRFDEADAAIASAPAVALADGPGEHAIRSTLLAMQAEHEGRKGEHGQAVRTMSAAITHGEIAFPPQGVNLAFLWVRRAEALRNSGAPQLAITDASRALEILTALDLLAVRHELGRAHTQRGLALLDVERVAEAASDLRDALRTFDPDDAGVEVMRAHAAFGMARALDALGQEPSRAHELARHSLQIFTAHGRATAEPATTVRAWLER